MSVEPFHLFRYLDEQSFRYNNRKLTDGERFSIAVSGIVGKRLTFDELNRVQQQFTSAETAEARQERNRFPRDTHCLPDRYRQQQLPEAET